MTFSQYEEDEIIQKYIYSLPPAVLEDYRCVLDLGASDGLTNSNIAQVLLSNPKNYFEHIFLIDTDAELLQNARHSYKDFTNIEYVSQRITRQNIDDYISKSKLSLCKFLILNIDIDGDDLEICKSLALLDSLIVIVEYNPTFGINYKYENPPSKNHGSSFLSIKEFMEKNQYSFIGSTKSNLIFGKACFDIYWKQEEYYSNHAFTQLGFGYNGDLITLTSDNDNSNHVHNVMFNTPWNQLMYRNSIPKLLRVYPLPKYVAHIYNLFYIISHPVTVMKQINARRSRVN
jgi:hypothetical protein